MAKNGFAPHKGKSKKHKRESAVSKNPKLTKPNNEVQVQGSSPAGSAKMAMASRKELMNRWCSGK